MQDYQIIATESLGLAQRRLIPRIAQLAREMQVDFNESFSQMFNSSVETEIEVVLLQSLSEQLDCVYTSIEAPSTGSLTLSILEQSLIKLTSHYLNEPMDGQGKVDNTALRFFDRLAKRVIQEVGLLTPTETSQIVVSKKLPSQAIILKFNLSTNEQLIQFDAILNNDLIEKLTQGYLPHSDITRQTIEASLLSVEVDANVTLMQRSLTLGEISSLVVGDIISMELNEQAPFLIGDKQLFTGQVSNNNGRLHFTVNDTQENQA